MILKIIKVTGRSLYPVYQDGDFVIISKIPILFGFLRPGNVVVFNHPAYGRLIKRVARIEEGGKRLFVVGENEESVDSRSFGSIATQWVQGKVIWSIFKRGLRVSKTS